MSGDSVVACELCAAAGFAVSLDYCHVEHSEHFSATEEEPTAALELEFEHDLVFAIDLADLPAPRDWPKPYSASMAFSDEQVEIALVEENATAVEEEVPIDHVSLFVDGFR